MMLGASASPQTSVKLSKHVGPYLSFALLRDSDNGSIFLQELDVKLINETEYIDPLQLD